MALTLGFRSPVPVTTSTPPSGTSEGDTALTAFVPRDRAFQYLVGDLTGTKPATEQAVLNALGRSEIGYRAATFEPIEPSGGCPPVNCSVLASKTATQRGDTPRTPPR